MTRCLTPDEFVDLLEGTLASERRAHVGACAACLAMAAEVREALALALAGSDAVPEPPAHFWPSVNARVRTRTGDAVRTGWPAWFRWDVLVPMVGLAALVVALASAVDRRLPVAAVGAPAQEIDGPGMASLAEGGTDADEAFAMMLDLVGSLPEGGFEALGVRALPEMGEAAAVLSADERRALVELLARAVEGPRS